MTTTLLLTTALFIGFTHTLIGIDHYVPFVVLSKANAWSLRKTMLIVVLCGIGHVLSSVVLGLIGIAMSQSLSFLVNIETIRGSLATSFLIGFGLVYTTWALTQIYRNKPHSHAINGVKHTHDHHEVESAQTHHEAHPKKSLNTIWGLFILFVLGPCEPLIPLLMFPAATQNSLAFLGVIGVFSSVSILTMVGATWIGIKGLTHLKFDGLEKYTHALAGTAITLCGIMILTLGI